MGAERGDAMTEDEDYDALSQKHLASIKRDTRVSLEDAAVRATHKVMAEFERETLAQPEQEQSHDCKLRQALIDFALENSIKPNSMGDKLLFKSTAIMLSGMPITAPQKPEQEPVAIVIEELEHDGQGFCAKVRWLYNPVPVNETLSWEHPK